MGVKETLENATSNYLPTNFISDKIDQCLEKHRPTQPEIDRLNRPVIYEQNC